MMSGLFGPARYDRTTVLLHWAVALLVVMQWLGAHSIDWFPKGPYRVDARSVHIVFGCVLTAAMAYRIMWRTTSGTRFARDRRDRADMLAVGVHYALYALVLAVLGLGLFNAWLRGDDIFGLFHLPKFGTYAPAARHALVEQVVGLHATCSNALLILAGGHASAALVHHFVLKDGVLRRMSLR